MSEAESDRKRLAKDPYRPAYHFLAPVNCLSDPNGPIFWKGKYHLFYQYYPYGAYPGKEPWSWGHAVSEDLVHWTDLPIAVTPDRGGADEGGCWSGTAFLNKEGIPTIIYYGKPRGVCIATSTGEDLVRWEKHPANPVIPHPSGGQEYQVFDPCCWVEGETYYALTGGMLPKSPKGRPSAARDVAFLFRSTDLEHWEYLHLFYEGGKFTEGGEDCAVPQFFPLGRKHVLLFASHSIGSQCYIGTYADQRFHPEQHKRFTYGSTGRAGSICEGYTLVDGDGRTIFFGRIAESRHRHVQRASGWSGMIALPMVLSLSPEEELLMTPVSELEALRGDHRHFSDIPIPENGTVPLEGVEGERLEITAVFDCQETEEVGLKVRCSPNGEEQTLIRFNSNPKHRHPRSLRKAMKQQGTMLTVPPVGELILDISRSSMSSEVYNRDSQRCKVPLPEKDILELRVFVDRSVVEVFADRRHYLTRRIYPARQDSLGLQLFAVGGKARLKSLDVWQMRAIWPIA